MFPQPCKVAIDEEIQSRMLNNLPWATYLVNANKCCSWNLNPDPLISE